MITREIIYDAIIECRHRVMRGTVYNYHLNNIISECTAVMTSALGKPSAIALYPNITEQEQINIENQRRVNRQYDITAMHAWLIVAAKLNTLLTENGWKFSPSEFMTIS